MSRLFLRPPEYYQRDLDPLKSYIDQSAYFISKMTGKDLVSSTAIVKQTLNSDKVKAKDPVVKFFRREDNGDRAVDHMKLSSYIKEVVDKKELLAPTFTSYISHTKKRSFLVDFVLGNVKERSIAKKEAFSARTKGDTDTFVLKNNEQVNKKLANNSVSGAFASNGTPLVNSSAHSTLTSITRTLSSIGNSSNEKLISGNRHYYSYEVTLNNLISIASSIDETLFNEMLRDYGLVYPTVDDVIDMVRYSSDLYWHDLKKVEKLRVFVSKLSDVERAAVMYIGDLYHIRKLNDGFTRQLLEDFSRKITTETTDPIGYLKNSNEGLVNLTHLICSEEIKGLGSNYDKIPIEIVNTLASTCKGLLRSLEKYDYFIKEIFLTRNIPSSLANIKHQVRRTVVLSDTDSTMFSIDEYVKWYYGDYRFTPEAFALASSVMYLTTETMSHLLAVFSANLGASEEFIHTLAMKPEFSFKVFLGPQALSKHYIATLDAQEGDIFATPKMEIKGVHLKSSATPKKLVAKAHARMQTLTEEIKTVGSFSMRKELEFVASIEAEIKTSLLKGEVDYYRHTKIKTAEAYTNEISQSPYVHHLLWKEVFADKYGPIDEPPYLVVKIPTIATTKTTVNDWLESIKDETIRVKLAEFLIKHKKNTLPTMYISDEYVKAFGIPEEITPIINTKKIILDLTNINRLTLESLGYSPKTNWTITELLNQ